MGIARETVSNGSDTVKQNREALRRIAAIQLTELRKKNPDWNLRDLRQHLSIPLTKLFQDLAREAGFDVVYIGPDLNGFRFFRLAILHCYLSVNLIRT